MKQTRDGSNLTPEEASDLHIGSALIFDPDPPKMGEGECLEIGKEYHLSDKQAYSQEKLLTEGELRDNRARVTRVEFYLARIGGPFDCRLFRLPEKPGYR